ncbi:MAG: uroporphyrinogen decarboxylase family protein [Victivallales bacterium]|nr:uroporphyrinogen decarboxylase family protein [Victivallales bacterium]
MNNRERLRAIMNYENYDRLPVVHFGLWDETLQKWIEEGYLSRDEAEGCSGGNPPPAIMERLGFDFGWGTGFAANTGLGPAFTLEVVEELPDGSKKVRNSFGVIVLQLPEAGSIPAEFDHLLKDRASWEEHFLPRLRFSETRIDFTLLEQLKTEQESRREPLGLACGSMIGTIRNWLGVTGVSYLWADDPELYDEIIDTSAELTYKCLEAVLQTGIKFDYGNFWEDICFKNGPLVVPSVFDEKCGPHYRRITALLKKYGIATVSLDCDGLIDALIPTWLNNGVNTMFPIEVGTWNASIAPWRERYGRELRGVGGMNKNVFAQDFAAVDAEIARLRPLIELGGFIPCPDHRIPPDAEWDNVRYYCDQMHQLF